MRNVPGTNPQERTPAERRQRKRKKWKRFSRAVLRVGNRRADLLNRSGLREATSGGFLGLAGGSWWSEKTKVEKTIVTWRMPVLRIKIPGRWLEGSSEKGVPDGNYRVRVGKGRSDAVKQIS